jgi:small subunit ribosomal protein S17
MLKMLRSNRSSKIGVVLKKSSDKTLVVSVEFLISHPVYKKVQKKSKKYLVHCLDKNIKVGELVKITSSRPFSKNKSWLLVSREEKK